MEKSFWYSQTSMMLHLPRVININYLVALSIHYQEETQGLENDHRRKHALIFYKILLTYSIKKGVEISLENLFMDTGAQRVNLDTKGTDTSACITEASAL